LKSIVEISDDLDVMRQRTNDFFNQLLATKYDFNESAHYAEVIPFHVFWTNHGEQIAA
jgi:hypothetical protein